MVAELSKRIKFTDDVSFDLKTYFPVLLWVIRDFHLELIDENGMPMTRDEYLESALQDQPGFSPEINERNKIRKLIKAFFGIRHCYTLVRPADEEDHLKDLATNKAEVRSQFWDQVEGLKKLVFSELRPKCINNVPMTGRMFVGFAEKIVACLNKGAVRWLKR